MKVRILKGVVGAPWHLAYFPGDVADLNDPLALELIEAKAAEEVKDLRAPKETTIGAAPASEKATAKGPKRSRKATKK